MIKERLKHCYDWNVHLQAKTVATLHARRNATVRAYVDEVSRIDSIADFDVFRDAVTRMKWGCPRISGRIAVSGVASESMLYGHLRALVEYAGREFDPIDRLLLPYIEHGIHWLAHTPPNACEPYVHCMVSQGGYRKALLQKVVPGIPQYVVGPYIHYARPYP